MNPPRWPADHFDPRTATLTLDYPLDTPGLMTYQQVQDIDEYGVIRRITAASSATAGWLSLTYPSHDALASHIGTMKIHQAKLAAFDEQGPRARGQELAPNPKPLAPAPEPARLVFGRMSARDGRKLAQQAQAPPAGTLRQEALL